MTIHKIILIALLLFLIGCSENYKINIPDNFYTIETEVLNLSEARKLQFSYQFSEYYQLAGGKTAHYYLNNSISDEDKISNCDIRISFPIEEYDYHLFVKSFNNIYRSFLYKQKRISSDDLGKIETKVHTSVDSISFNKIFESNVSVENYKINKLIVDFSKEIEDLTFFKEIQIF